MKAALAVLLLAAAAHAGPVKRAGNARSEAAMSRVEEVAGGRFSAAVPKGWRVTKDGSGTALQVTGPDGKGAPAPAALAVYYVSGNPFFKDAADFLARQTAPSPVPVAGEKTGPVEDALLSGRPAKRLRRDTFAVHRAPAAEPREVPVREEVTVLGGKAGFWVVTVRAPTAVWTKHAAAFAAFRDGFKALD